MPYESLGKELESRLGRKAEFLNQEETLDFRAENWGGDPDGPLAKALAKARLRAKQPKKPLTIERIEEKAAEEGDDCPSCANACKHDDIKRIKVESIYDYEVQSPSNMVIQVICLDCGESGTFYADDVDWHDEEAKLRYSPQITVNMMNPTYGDLRCSRCHERFQMAAEKAAETIIPDEVRKKVLLGWSINSRKRDGVFRHPRHIREIKESETKKPRKRRGIKRWGKHPYARKSSRRAESFDLPETQQRILKYLSRIHPDRIHNWDPPKGLTQREIGEAVGVVRTNAATHLNELIELGLVKMAKKRPVGERRLQKVYFPTFAGRRVGDSFASESMLVDLDGDGVIEPWEIEAQESNLTGLAIIDDLEAESFAAQGRKTGVVCDYNGCKGNLLESEYGKASKLHCDKCNYSEVIEWDAEFEAMGKGLGDNLREAAIEVLQDRKGWIGMDELTILAAQKMYEKKPGRRKDPQTLKRVLARAIGKSVGGRPPFYITRDGRIYYYGDQDRGEFIKGVI